MHNLESYTGAYRDDDGIAHPNRNYKYEADKFVERVYARGSIDPARWSLYVEETAEEREAYNRKCESDERAWAGCR